MGKRIEEIGAELGRGVKGDVLVDIFNRAAFSTDASIYQVMPVCVVCPRDVDDVVSVVKYAHANNIAVVGRGAGSGVAGESLCSGIVINLSRYMSSIIGVEDEGRVVVCEAGVVLDDLNGYLAEYGRKIGPDPSSSNRAVAGGVVANNSTGSHSLEYGSISDYVERVEVVLADGSVVEFVNDYEAGDDRAGDIARGCVGVLEGKDELIDKATAGLKGNRSGYNIKGICRGGRIDLAKLMAGSEGTLGIFTKIALRTVAVPRAKGIVQFEFDSMAKMAAAVGPIVETGASACELMDKALIDMAVEGMPEYGDVLPQGCAAVLMVEHAGDSEEEVREKITRTDAAVGSIASERVLVFDEQRQKRLWKSRKDAVGLLNRRKGSEHPVAFIEDVIVSNNCLGRFIAGLGDISWRYDISMSFYGHAGVGELHVRPYLDLSRAADVEKMQRMAADVFELAWLLGGAISGEHADGLVRAGFIKKQYGAEYYEVLRAIKNVFDPGGLMNPGKIINDDADVMIKNLRASRMVVGERAETNLLFGPNEFRFEIEQCNGDGVCLSTQPGARMCPVYRALGEELACSRAKANLLRAWITGMMSEGDFESEEFKKILGMCINCRMCSVECPSGVDVSRLVVEARAEYVKRKGLSKAEWALVRNRYMSIAGSLFGPLSNFVMGLRAFKWVMEKVIGLDKRRGMPGFERGAFVRKGRKYLAKQEPIEKPADKVAYFVDSFANYNDHELGFAVIKVLRANGIDVVLPSQRPAPLPGIAYGDLAVARRDLGYIVEHLAPLVEAGYKIVCSEPSAALCLKDDLGLLIDSEQAKSVSENTYELMGYLNGLFKEGKLREVAAEEKREFVYHAPCHLCVLGGSEASIELLAGIGGGRITDISAGCCGLAGTCGMQKKNFELSVAIGKEMVEAIEAMGAENVLTECAACKMQIEQLTDKKVIHPVKILANLYGI